MKSQLNGVRPEEVEKVLESFEHEYVWQKGSHKHYLNKNNRRPDNNQAGKYIKKSLQ